MACRRVDSSSGWRILVSCGASSGVISPVGGGFGTLVRCSAGGFFQWVEESGRLEACQRVDSSSDWGIWDCGVLLVRLWRDGVLVCWASVAAARLVGWVGVARLVRLDCGDWCGWTAATGLAGLRRLVRRGCSGWAGAAGA